MLDIHRIVFFRKLKGISLYDRSLSAVQTLSDGTKCWHLNVFGVFFRPACPYLPFPATTPARLGYGGEADSPAGESLPGADPEDRCLPLWHRHQAWKATPQGQQVSVLKKRSSRPDLKFCSWNDKALSTASILHFHCNDCVHIGKTVCCFGAFNFTERWWTQWSDILRCRSLATGSLVMMARGTCTRLIRCPSEETG